MLSILELVAALAAVNIVNAGALLPRNGGGGRKWHHTGLEQPTPEVEYYISYGTSSILHPQ